MNFVKMKYLKGLRRAQMPNAEHAMKKRTYLSICINARSLFQITCTQVALTIYEYIGEKITR
jgi:hypothetical protein